MGHMGPSTHSLLMGQLPYFHAGLGSTKGTFSLDMEVCLPKCQDEPGTQGSGEGLASPPFWISPQDLDCFVIDHNGFILISERPQEVRHWK